MAKKRIQSEAIINPEYFIDDSEINDLYEKSRFSDVSRLDVKQSVIDKDYVKLVEWQTSPDKFMRDITMFEPWTCHDADDQLDIALAIRDHDRVSVRSGNGVGKTAISAQIGLWFLYCFPPAIVVTTAPTTRQVEKLLWGEIRKYHKGASVPLGGERFTTEIRIDEDWYAIGFATDEPERFQGFHAPNILIIADEASGIGDPIFGAIEGLATSAHVRILMIGNPTDPSSYFGRSFLHPRESKQWYKLAISCWNSPNVRTGINDIPALCARDWPKARLKAWGEYNPFYQVRVLGNFPEAGEDNLIPYHMVHSALERIEKGVGNKIISVDVARFGNDKSCIARLWGNNFRILRRLHKQDGDMLANATVEQVKKDENRDITEIKIDIIGWGASCYDSLVRRKREGNKVEKEILQNVRITGINVSERCRSSKARKDFYNVRAEAGFAVRKMFEEDAIDIDDEELGVQAANLKYKFQQGRYLLEEKQDYKKRTSSESPDELDTLIIAKAITRGGIPTIF